MAKASKTADQVIEKMDQILTQVEKPHSIEEMPLNSLEDYVAYNIEARKLNRKLKMCRYPIKQCPEELHPKERVVFNRNDQPSNPLPAYVSDHMIDFKKTLIPGKTYDLPRYIVEYLSKKGYPEWDWFVNPDGSKETRIARTKPRFSLRTVY